KMFAFYRDVDHKDKRKGKARSLPKMKNRFRAHIKDANDLNDLRIFEKTGIVPKNKVDGFNLLAADLKKKFDEKIEKGVPIHDRDIRAMAKSLNRLGDYRISFKVSRSWITRWKRHHNLVSRKVTKYVTKKSVKDLEKTKQLVKELIDKFLAIVAANPGIVVANCDQTGVQMEMHSSRTIFPKGSKKVEVIVKSKSALTHSLTLLPTIYSDGRQHPVAYVHLGEPSGKLPQKGC
ncbi:hypothetical protein PMAYCL1PPCAC_13731, partial [Pristionchus mayeri]